MFSKKYVKFSQKTTCDFRKEDSVLMTNEEHRGADSVQTCPTRKLSWTGSSYYYASSKRKPQLLVQLESYMNKELQNISSSEPNSQNLKLQVYRNVFSSFISAFRTYQPLLSAIKEEYENTLGLQRDQILELEPMRSQLRLATEECDQKLQMQRKEMEAEIGILKKEKQKLQEDINSVMEKEKTMQTVVDHLQSELADQYLQYRKECDARKLLIWQLNDLMQEPVTIKPSAEYTRDTVELELALKVCRADLTKTQEQLFKLKAEYWDFVPRRDWDTLEKKHNQTLLQLKTLQSEFDLMKSEYDTLLEIHKMSSMAIKTTISRGVQTGEDKPEEQEQIQSSQME